MLFFDNNGHGTPEPEEAVAQPLPFYLAPWAMFPVFSLPCRLCLLMSWHADCTRAGSAPSCEGQVPLWGCELRTLLGGAIVLWHIFGIPGRPLPCPGLARPSLWRSSSDLGPRALHYYMVAESYADCLPVQVVPLLTLR